MTPKFKFQERLDRQTSFGKKPDKFVKILPRHNSSRSIKSKNSGPVDPTVTAARDVQVKKENQNPSRSKEN